MGNEKSYLDNIYTIIQRKLPVDVREQVVQDLIPVDPLEDIIEDE